MKADKDIKPENGDIRLLSVDNEAVVPVNKTVVLQITAADVIHSFIVQSFGMRIDAVPGRLNETWFKADREGVYYGQCSKICGKDHAFMPIAFRVVSQEKYQAWLADAKKKYAAAPSADTCRRRDRDGHSSIARADRRDGTSGKKFVQGHQPWRRPPQSTLTTDEHRPSDGLAPLSLFDQPQGYRHALSDLRDHRRADRQRACRARCAWS